MGGEQKTPFFRLRIEHGGNPNRVKKCKWNPGYLYSGGRHACFPGNGLLFFGVFPGLLFGTDLVIPHKCTDLGVIEILAICVILKRAFRIFL